MLVCWRRVLTASVAYCKRPVRPGEIGEKEISQQVSGVSVCAWDTVSRTVRARDGAFFWTREYL